ncbi:MAG: class I SAM-dependent methyltransferase [Candidatus Hodarchaeota archaeon]
MPVSQPKKTRSSKASGREQRAKEALTCLKLSRHDPTKGSLLDLGCGLGELTGYFLGEGISTVGLDINKESLRSVKEKNPRVKLILADGLKLPFKEKCFHTVILNDVLEHVTYKAGKLMLNQIFVILRKRGKLYISVANKYQIREPHTFAFFLTWLPRTCYLPIFRSIGSESIYPYTVRMLERLCKETDFTFENYTWFYARKKILNIDYIGDPITRKVVALLRRINLHNLLFRIAEKFSVILFVCKKGRSE